jgi:hypothetical protein
MRLEALEEQVVPIVIELVHQYIMLVAVVVVQMAATRTRWRVLEA